MPDLPTELKLYATPGTLTDLSLAASILSLSRTDTANRGIQVYAALLDAGDGQEVLLFSGDRAFQRTVTVGPWTRVR